MQPKICNRRGMGWAMLQTIYTREWQCFGESYFYYPCPIRSGQKRIKDVVWNMSRLFPYLSLQFTLAHQCLMDYPPQWHPSGSSNKMWLSYFLPFFSHDHPLLMRQKVYFWAINTTKKLIFGNTRIFQ